MPPQAFRFLSDDVFVLYGRGIVFRGTVRNGKITTRKRVRFETGDGPIEATVAAIELNRKLIAEMVADREIGLLLKAFDKALPNKMIDLVTEHPKNLPTPTEMLRIALPVELAAVSREPSLLARIKRILGIC